MLFLCGLSAALAYISLSEWTLANKGFQVTIQDDEERWIGERIRARELGKRALILVGGSRVQLDFDLAALRGVTGLEPVQLAIDGSSFVPVFEGLADDPAIDGTIFVGINIEDIGNTGRDDGHKYQEDFEHGRYRQPLTYQSIEAALGRMRDSVLRNYSDGAQPWDALQRRLLNPRPTRQYLATYPDRSRAADYSMVPMPGFYLSRAIRHLGEPLDIPQDANLEQIEGLLASRIANIRPRDNRIFLDALPRLERAVDKIQARGGKVIFILMPVSGFVRSIDGHRYPKELFWDRLAATTSARTIHFGEYPDLSGFNCPDGSHLDQRDRSAFTQAIARHLNIRTMYREGR